MNIKSLLLLTLISFWAGLCSAQMAKKYYLYNGFFFEGMPPGVCSSDLSALITYKDAEGCEVIELKLQKGRKPADGYQHYHTPVSEIPQADYFLTQARQNKGVRLPIMSTHAGKRDSWIGKPFPECRVTDMTGKVWTKSDIVGKPMVLNFWYIGCGPCRAEMPELNRWVSACPEVTYWATTFNDAAQIEPIVEKTPFLFTQIPDELFFFKLFEVSGMPVTILVDKQGIVRHIEEGAGAAKLRYLFDFLQKLVRE